MGWIYKWIFMGKVMKYFDIKVAWFFFKVSKDKKFLVVFLW